MSRSHRDQRGKRTNGEIGGLPAILGDQVRNDFGWEPTGSPNGKRSAKQSAARQRRRVAKQIVIAEIRTQNENP